MENMVCLEDSVANIAQAVKANGNGGSLKDIADAIREGNGGSGKAGGVIAIQLKSFPDKDYGPYPQDKPIIEILGTQAKNDDKYGYETIDLRMGDCSDAAYLSTGTMSDLVAWKKGGICAFYLNYSGNIMVRSIGIYNASYKLLRQIDLLLYFTGGYQKDGTYAPRMLKSSIVREYKTANL